MELVQRISVFQDCSQSQPYIFRMIVTNPAQYFRIVSGIYTGGGSFATEVRLVMQEFQYSYLFPRSSNMVVDKSGWVYMGKIMSPGTELHYNLYNAQTGYVFPAFTSGDNINFICEFQ